MLLNAEGGCVRFASCVELALIAGAGFGLRQEDAELRRSVQAAMFDGPAFSEAVTRWIGQRPEFTKDATVALNPFPIVFRQSK
eukprot:5350769-Amphidinium_carterae.1